MSAEEIKVREAAESYAASRGFRIMERLGWGIHGTVWKVNSRETTGGCVLKMHRHAAPWRREVACYERLREMGVGFIEGVSIPSLLHSNADWLALEITIVKPPFLLDFGTAWLDERPDFPPEVWEQKTEDGAEKFGEDWERACAIIHALEVETGVIMGDMHPGNLALRRMRVDQGGSRHDEE